MNRKLITITLPINVNIHTKAFILILVPKNQTSFPSAHTKDATKMRTNYSYQTFKPLSLRIRLILGNQKLILNIQTKTLFSLILV